MTWVRGYEFYPFSFSESASDASLGSLLSLFSSSISLFILFASVSLLKLPEHFTDQCILAPKLNSDAYFCKLIFDIRTQSFQTLIQERECFPSIEFSKDYLSKTTHYQKGDGISGLTSKACFHT